MMEKMKRIRLKWILRMGFCLALIAAMVLIGAVLAGAEEIQYSEGLYFDSNGDGTCCVGIGTCRDTEIMIPPVSPEGDKVIGTYPGAFYCCRNITSITFPEDTIMTMWGAGTFYGCSSLKSIHLNGAVYASYQMFDGCSSLERITVAGIENLVSEEAFWGCYSLKEIYIKASLTSRLTYSFSGSYNLESITVEDGNPVYHSEGNTLIETSTGTVILGCQNSVIPADGSVTNIGGSAFRGCSGLTHVAIPKGITDIASSAFIECNNISNVYYAGTQAEWNELPFSDKGVFPKKATIHYNTCLDENGLAYTSNGDGTCYISGIGTCTDAEIVIPSVSPMGDRVTGIGEYAFAGNIGISTVFIPGSVTSIGSHAFEYCRELTDVTLSKGIVSIGAQAFYECDKLVSVLIPDGVEIISGGAFEHCDSLVRVTMTDSVTELGGFVFLNSKNLESIKLSDNIVVLREGVLANTNIVNIDLPENLTKIETDVFVNCTSLPSLHIPAKVTVIVDCLIYGCTSLQSITIAPDNPVYHSDGNCIIETATKTIIAGCNSSVIPLDGSVTAIGCNAFNGMSFSRIVIPDTVTSIRGGAFGYCENLTDVFYLGTEEEWNEINLEVSCNDELINATIHFLGDRFDLTSASLTLGDSLTMNYYAKADPAYSNVKMRFTYRGKTETVRGIPTEKDGEYIFSLKGIAPQCMGETIKAELIVILENGTELVVDTKASYSVREYCDDALAANPNNEALTTLLADLLAYGDASQSYTGFNADTPASEGFEVTPSEWEDVTDTDFTLSDKTREELCFTAAGVRFGYINRVYFKIKAADLTGVTLTVNGKTYTADDLTLAEDTADTYIFYTNAVYATEFDKVFTAELSADGEVIQTVTYSVKSYVCAKQNSNDTEIAALVKALYNYGRSAIAYKNAQ